MQGKKAGLKYFKAARKLKIYTAHSQARAWEQEGCALPVNLEHAQEFVPHAANKAGLGNRFGHYQRFLFKDFTIQYKLH